MNREKSEGCGTVVGVGGIFVIDAAFARSGSPSGGELPTWPPDGVCLSPLQPTKSISAAVRRSSGMAFGNITSEPLFPL